MYVADCLFCRIAAGEVEASKVYEDESVLAFLDHRPIFKGHLLVVPRTHHETLSDIPADALAVMMSVVQRLARVVETALEAQGTFVAINNRVSQSVPHLHVHIVPRRKGDGLRGFFWPRTRYASAEEREEYAQRLRKALGE